MADQDHLTQQLNSLNEEPVQPPHLQNRTHVEPGLNPQMQAEMAARQAEEMKAKMDARPMHLDPLKGKLDIKYFGHAGFKISFLDDTNRHRNIYIDIWVDNPLCPEEEKKECPNDMDLALVTHGQLDHSMHAPFLLMAGKREDRKIVCTSETGTFYELFRRIPPGMITKMQRGGSKDFGFCKITAVHADHPSTCVGPQGVQISGGNAVGFIIYIPNHDITFYHMGDTNVFSDMKLIDDLYKPDVVFIPIGDCLGMGPREAAYACKHFLPTPKKVIPMHFETFPVLTGTVEAFKEEMHKLDVKNKEIIDPKTFFGGQEFLKKDESF